MIDEGSKSLVSVSLWRLEWHVLTIVMIHPHGVVTIPVSMLAGRVARAGVRGICGL